MEGSWVGAWGASPAFPNGPDMGGRTIRQVMRLSVGGSRLRIRLDNTLGRAPLLVNAATIALPGEVPGSIHPATVRRLTFGGRAHVLVQPGAAFISDVLDGDVEALQRVCIDLHVARSTGITATHPLGQATTWISRAGDVTGQTVLPDSEVETARFFVSHIEVDAPGAFTLVALGDSITDGYGTTPDRDHRWPDILAERLVKAGQPVGIVNAGISSNRVLYDCPEGASGPSALARFDREVLAVPNVRVMTLLESINDIGHPGARGLHDQSASADDIIVGMSQLLDRAHTHGIRIIGGTLTPFAGTIFPGYYSPEGEAIRQAVNGWIRTKANFDAVVDFDSAVRDPVVPERLHEAFDLGDGLHLNDAGYRRMAEAIDLSMLLP